jgi:alanine racemase
MHTRPVWAEISRQNLISNYLELCRLAKKHTSESPAETSLAIPAVLGVVKANAYGHGMSACAELLHGAGAQWLGITSTQEAVECRAVCPAAEILVMSGIWDGEAGAIVEHRLTPLVWESFHLDLLEAEARRQGLPPRSIAVHLEFDTGMSRQGVRLQGRALQEILMRFHSGSALRLEGIATHFSEPEVKDSQETERQRSSFETALDMVRAAGHRPLWVHAGNSATLLRGDQLRPLAIAAERIGSRLMVRPGLSLYGYAPWMSEDADVPAPREDLQLHRVLAWKTRIVSLRLIEKGETAGYNSTFRAYRTTQLALLPMGYGDGLNRLLSNRGSVLVHGQRAPIAGRISMDQTILDVTDIPGVKIGDEAVVLGQQGQNSIDAWEIANLRETIAYEVLCDIAARVPRVLVD